MHLQVAIGNIELWTQIVDYNGLVRSVCIEYGVCATFSQVNKARTVTQKCTTAESLRTTGIEINFALTHEHIFGARRWSRGWWSSDCTTNTSRTAASFRNPRLQGPACLRNDPFTPTKSIANKLKSPKSHVCTQTYQCQSHKAHNSGNMQAVLPRAKVRMNKAATIALFSFGSPEKSKHFFEMETKIII